MLILGTETAGAAELASGEGWTLDDAGVLTLTKDVESASAYDWAPHASRIKEVKVAEGVTEIPVMAFSTTQDTTYSQLHTFTSSSTLRVVGGAAFSGTSSLTKVNLNDGLEELQITAFSGTGIQEIDIPADVDFGSDVFTYCTNLKHVTVGGGATWSGNAQFYGCANLETIILEEGTVTIPNQFVNNCPNLKKIWIPRSVTEIDNAAIDASWETWGSPILNGCIIGYSNTIAEKYVERWDGKHGYPGSYPVTFHAIDGTEHAGAWQTTVSPTCTTAGQERLTCDICETMQTRELAATGHTWDGGVVAKEPSASENGMRIFTCIKCGETKTEVIASPSAIEEQPKESENESRDARLPQTGDRSSLSIAPFVLSMLLLAAGILVGSTGKLPNE